MKTSPRLIGLLVIVGIVALYLVDFFLWRAGHPQAPAWTYLAH
jgi:hypothetical protein